MSAAAEETRSVLPDVGFERLAELYRLWRLADDQDYRARTLAKQGLLQLGCDPDDIDGAYEALRESKRQDFEAADSIALAYPGIFDATYVLDDASLGSRSVVGAYLIERYIRRLEISSAKEQVEIYSKWLESGFAFMQNHFPAIKADADALRDFRVLRKSTLDEINAKRKKDAALRRSQWLLIGRMRRQKPGRQLTDDALAKYIAKQTNHKDSAIRHALPKLGLSRRDWLYERKPVKAAARKLAKKSR